MFVYRLEGSVAAWNLSLSLDEYKDRLFALMDQGVDEPWMKEALYDLQKEWIIAKAGATELGWDGNTTNSPRVMPMVVNAELETRFTFYWQQSEEGPYFYGSPIELVES
jgi:hypothetical protein